MTRTRASRSEGAVAVEFVLIVPILILLVLVLVDFGRVMYVQISLNSGAKEAVRALALGNSGAETDAAFLARVASVGRQAASGAGSIAQLTQTPAAISLCATTSVSRTGSISTSCPTVIKCSPAGTITTLSLATRFKWLTPISLMGSFSEFNISGKAASICMAT